MLEAQLPASATPMTIIAIMKPMTKEYSIRAAPERLRHTRKNISNHLGRAVRMKKSLSSNAFRAYLTTRCIHYYPRQQNILSRLMARQKSGPGDPEAGRLTALHP